MDTITIVSADGTGPSLKTDAEKALSSMQERGYGGDSLFPAQKTGISTDLPGLYGSIFQGDYMIFAC